MIARSVNNDFELEKINGSVEMGWNPQTEKMDVGGLLAVGDLDVIAILS